MSIYRPYTYLIGWTEHNKWYYGVRYAKNCNPNDLWISYFTSSKHVKRFREMNGEPDVIRIRRTFIDAESAIEWERRVLIKMDVLHREDFMNMNISGAILLTDEMKKKISKATTGHKHWLGKTHTEETRLKMRKPKTKEHKEKLSEAKRSDQKYREIAIKNGMIAANLSRGKSREKLAAENARLGKIGLAYKIVICPHCGKDGGSNAMARWHFDNCKSIP